MFEVAVIIINYNSSDYTFQCVKSIIEKTNSKLNYQIVIVDNASEMEDFLQLKNNLNSISFQNLSLHRSKINTGFGGGNMFGVQFANAEYYAFVNNDSLFNNDCLSIIKTEMQNNPNLGICGPKCFKEDGSVLPTLDHFASPLKELFGRKILEKINPNEYPNRKKEYTLPQKGQLVSGSFMMLKSADFNAVGGFDTNIFLYYEETDLCKRLRKINKFAYLIPNATFIHFHGVSTPKSLAIKTELKLSMLYVIRKHNGYLWHKFILIYLSIKYFFSSIFKPKYWKLFATIVTGASLSNSLKVKQKLWDL